MGKTHCIVFVLFVALSIMGATADAARDKRCPRNETWFDCGANCQTLCSTLGEPCDRVFIRCPDGCYCDEGFARNDRGRCIPISQCNKKNY